MISLEDLRCVICKDVFEDPRHLPCGHSYCGPSRSCLESLSVPGGGILCAMCRVEHRVKINDLPPLYGIRDFIHSFVESKPPVGAYVPCSNHVEYVGTLWCHPCEVVLCDGCFDDHDGHLVRRLKNYLIEKIEAKWGTPWRETFIQDRPALQKRLENKTSELEELTEQIEQVRAEIETLNQHEKLINEYSKFLNQQVPNNKTTETFLLFKISKIEPLGCTKRVTEEYMDPKKDQLPSATRVTSSSNAVFACFLTVQSREPFQTCNSDKFSFGQFRFWLHTKVVYYNSQKTLRISLNCDMADGSRPPTFDMRYKFRLINQADDQLTKNKYGTWNYPWYEKLYWHPISNSDIIEDAGGWIAKSNEKMKEFISILLEVVEVKVVED